MRSVASVVVVLIMLVASCSTTATIDIEPRLTTADVFADIEDSIVYVLSPDAQTSGSGVVIEGGWILTNAHVVDRQREMRIGRSDGEDLGSFPVRAADWVYDLALIGPLDPGTLEPMVIGDSAALPIGAPTLLVGFPDEEANFPTPTLTEGILSRRRSIALADIPYLQVDATIAPGQSGGALVNEAGELIGISGLEFGQGEFGLALASEALGARIALLESQEYTPIPEQAPVTSLTAEAGPIRNFSFLADVDESGKLDILATSDADLWVDVQTLGGVTIARDSLDPFRQPSRTLYFDEQRAGGEEVIADLDPGMYQIMLGAYVSGPTEVTIASSNELLPLEDPEDGRELPVGEVVEGQFNWVRDTDRWELTLQEGDEATVSADGIPDTILVVRLNGELITSSDDEGLGVWGTGSRATFTAAEAGTYDIEIGSFDQNRWGYLIEATVER